VNLEKLGNGVEKGFRRFAYKERNNYCAPGFSDSKRNAVRMVCDKIVGDRYAYGNHTEIRIFNSTTEYAKIMRRIESVMKLFRRCLKPTVVSQPLDAAVENVPATPVTETVAA
jgi:hypothetical protein